ncbi:MAG: response regulator [Candidatus Latescibacteria bacterium]|nr:response regulator [Candidatus Latescibacterota bacterium]
MGTDKEKVLLIDDDEMNLRLVDGILDGTEFELFKTVDASEGIKIAKISKPKVILLDIMMPKYDGFMICKILKRSSETKNIPVIFLTAKKSKEDLVQAIKSGGSDYIVKPFSATDLLTKLRKIAGSIKGENVQTKNEKKTDTKDTEAQPEDTISNYQEVFPISFNKFNDVMVISTSVDSIIMANCQFLSNAFSTIVSDGIFKVVFDISEIKRIDGAGLALLISINETLKDYDGELHITFPNIDLNSCFSVIKLNYLFKTYESLQEAIESFQNPETESYEKPDIDYLSICKSCTYMNLPKARYCSFCGTNLMLGKGERIFEVLAPIPHIKSVKCLRNMS